ALEQPSAHLHRRRDRGDRQVPVLRHRISPEAGREGPSALRDAEARAPTRTLVIAPQWIGDAVMAEPLLATLAERGEAITVAARPTADGAVLRRACRRCLRCSTSTSPAAAARADRGDGRRAFAAALCLLDVRARCRIRAGEALAGRALRGARTRFARPRCDAG